MTCRFIAILLFIFMVPSSVCRFEGDKYRYERDDQPKSNQLPEIIGQPNVLCTNRFMILTVQTSKPLTGRIYVEDREFDERCSAELTNKHNSTIRLPILPCLIIDELLENTNQLKVWAYVRVNFHQVLITTQSRLFKVECSLSKAQVLDDVQQTGTVNSICQHSLKSPVSPYRIGQVLFHEWTCLEDYNHRQFLMLVRECALISKTKSSVLLIDEFGCIIDNNLISNLRHNDDELDGPQKYTAISQFFKFPGEDDIRFRCKILLVPRDTVETSAVKIPKCAGIEINSTPSTKNSISFPDEIETFTLSEWISVEDSMEDELLFENTNSEWTGNLSSLDELYSSRESTRHTRYSNRSKVGYRLRLASSEIADLNPINTENLDLSEEINEWIKMGNKSRNWHLNDLILKQSDENVKIFAYSASNSTRFNLTLPLNNKGCSAHMVNLLLLIWSITSTFAWLILLSYKIYQFLLKDYGPPIEDIDEGPQLYMPWLNSPNDYSGREKWQK